jgi:anti-anti-sigma factor
MDEDRYCPRCQHVVYRAGGPLAPRYCPRCFVHAHESVKLLPRPAGQRVVAQAGEQAPAMAMTTDGFIVRREASTRGVRILVSGELDIATAPQLQEECENQHPDEVAVVLLDLAAVTFIDSRGLHALTAAHEHLGDRLSIILSPACSHLVEVAMLRDTLPIIEG